MINLKKLFRRKKGQGALEYLFMIAAALIIIFVVVRYISGSTQQATSQTDIASLQSQAELARTTLQGKGYWDNNYYVVYNTNLYIKDSSGNNIAQDTNLDYEEEYDTEISWDTQTLTNNPTLKDIYDNCMNNNDKKYCYVLIDLQDAQKS